MKRKKRVGKVRASIKYNPIEIERRIEEDTRKEIEKIFENKKRMLGVEARLDLCFLGDFPIIGAHVYGEAFPSEKRVSLDVFAPDATHSEIVKIICEELIHIKHPEFLNHGPKFWKLVRECMDGR